MLRMLRLSRPLTSPAATHCRGVSTGAGRAGTTTGRTSSAAQVAVAGGLALSCTEWRPQLARCAATAPSASPVSSTAEPQLRFGAIADVQFADVDDQWNFQKTRQRAYRRALTSLRRAVTDWNSGPPLSFVANLGDIIDQQCESQGDSLRALQLVLDEFRHVAAPVQHMVGNHELYNFSREECAELIPNITPWYRSWTSAPNWRIVVLDAYELNIIERGGGPAVEEGMQYLGRFNPNDLRAPRGTVDVSVGLKGLDRRYLPMGGGYKSEQLRWLATELQVARKFGQRVIVLTHVPILPTSASPGALTWNYEEVVSVLRSAGHGVVAMVLAGHDHNGGYALDEEGGTHYVTLQSPLHTSAEVEDAHCTVEVFDDRVEILGRGIVPSRTLPLPPLPPPIDVAHSRVSCNVAAQPRPLPAARL